MQVSLKSFRIEKHGHAARVVCSIASPGFPETLWFETPSELTGYLSVAEPNWAAVALLYPAMYLGRSLAIEAPISPKLLFMLRNDLQALLSTYDPRLRQVEVLAEPSRREARPLGAGVATGFSAGVDSFSTFYRYTAGDVPASLRLTDLVIFDVGAFFGADPSSQYEHAKARCARFAAANGLGTLFARSNMDDLYRGVGVEPEFQHTHTLRSASAALLFEDYLGLFMYSSTYPYRNIRAAPTRNDTAYLDPILLPLLATERISFMSAAPGLSRAEKTALLADKEAPRSMLDVCMVHANVRQSLDYKNCSKCWKCIRTMVTLDALGCLDGYHQVFDIEYYRANRVQSMLKMTALARNGDVFAQEVVELARSRGLPMPPLRRRVASRVRGLARGLVGRFVSDARRAH